MELYEKFGQAIHVSIHPFFSKKKSKRVKNVLILLSGLNSYRNIVVFGMAIVKDIQSQTFVWVFESFFKINRVNITETVFTPRGVQIKNAIEKLVSNEVLNAHHLLEPYNWVK